MAIEHMNRPKSQVLYVRAWVVLTHSRIVVPHGTLLNCIRKWLHQASLEDIIAPLHWHQKASPSRNKTALPGW